MVSWTSPYTGARLHEALGRNWNLFGFLVLVVLLNFFPRRFVLRAALRSAPYWFTKNVASPVDAE